MRNFRKNGSNVGDLVDRIKARSDASFYENCVLVQEDLLAQQMQYEGSSPEWRRLNDELSLTGIFMTHELRSAVPMTNEVQQEVLAA